MSHEAYVLLPPTKINAQIESLAGYGNNVLLGTRQGHLILYSVEPNQIDNKMILQLLQYNGNFSKKAIMQMEVVPEYQLLFSLSDNILNVNDLDRNRTNFPIVHTEPKTKGATVFTLDVQRTTSLTGEVVIFVRLCVAVKRKLQFYYWKHDKLLELPMEIELNDVPKTLAWSGDTVCVGFKTEYALYDMKGTRRELFPTSSSRTIEPCITLIGQNVFGVARDEFLVAVNATAFASETEKAASVSSKSDFSALGTHKDGANALKSLTWSQPIQMVVWDEPYVISLINDALEIRVLDSVGRDKETLIQTLPEVQRARLLIKARQGLLFAASLSHLWCVQAVDIPKQRQNLLKIKRFQLALQLTNISNESKEDKEEKVYNIQTRYAYDLFENKQFEESMKEFLKLKTDPCDVIRLFPDLLPPDNTKASTTPAIFEKPNVQLEGRDLENGLLALIDYLAEIRYNLKDEILNYIESKSFNKQSTPILSIVCTTLLKCYLQTNDSLVASLLRTEPNFCHLEESERILKKYQKFGELIILYQTKKQHKKALQVLQSQAKNKDSCLFGYERTIQYLQYLGPENKQFIFEFAGWVLDEHPEDGLKIFTEDIHEVQNLPRAEVLDFLLKNHKSLVISYLEHVIHVWSEPKPIFHNILIQQYREKIKELKQDLMTDSTMGREKQKEITLETTRKKLIDFLQKSSKYAPEIVLADFPYTDLFEERAIILGKLGKHEKVLAIYIQILGDISKAISYCTEVYAQFETKNLPGFKVKDPEIYVILIKLLLKPPTAPPYNGVALHPKCLKPDTETVLEILETHGSKISAHSVLQILPDDIPLWRLSTFLEISLQNQLERKRKTQVLKGLLYAEHLQIQEQRLQQESKNVVITDYSVCPVCGKKFINQSAFARYPNGTIVHYSCKDKY